MRILSGIIRHTHILSCLIFLYFAVGYWHFHLGSSLHHCPSCHRLARYPTKILLSHILDHYVQNDVLNQLSSLWLDNKLFKVCFLALTPSWLLGSNFEHSPNQNFPTPRKVSHEDPQVKTTSLSVLLHKGSVLDGSHLWGSSCCPVSIQTSLMQYTYYMEQADTILVSLNACVLPDKAFPT